MNRSLIIGSSHIHDDSDCYIIAEIGHNHQGSLEKAKELFLRAKECGVNAVKLQKRDNRSLFTRAMYDLPYLHENSFGPTYGAHREAIADRYAGDELGKLWMDRFAYVKLVATVGPYLMRSSIIPWHRKIFIPVLVFRFAWMHRKRMRRAILGWIFPTLQRPRRRKVR